MAKLASGEAKITDPSSTKPALHSLAIRKAVCKAYAPILDRTADEQDLDDYLSPRQIGRIKKDAKAAGFATAGDYLDAFISRSINGLVDHLKAENATA